MSHFVYKKKKEKKKKLRRKARLSKTKWPARGEKSRSVKEQKKNKLDCFIRASGFRCLKYANLVTFTRSISVASLELRLKCFFVFFVKETVKIQEVRISSFFFKLRDIKKARPHFCLVNA